MLNKFTDKLNLRIITPNELHLPCLLTFVGLILGIISILFSPQLQSQFYNKVYIGSIFLFVFIFLLFKRKSALFLSAISLGLTLSNINLNKGKSESLYCSTIIEQKCIINGVISSHPTFRFGQWNYRLKKVKVIQNNTVKDLSTKTILVSLNSKVSIYDNIEISGELKPKDPNNNATYQLVSPILLKYRSNKNLIILSSKRILFCLNSALNSINNYSGRAILRSLITGDRSELSIIQKDVFKDSGLYHLLALSGLHIIIVITFLFLLLKPIPILQIYKNLIVIIGIWIFYLCAASPPTLFRAALSSSLYLASSLFQRKGSSKNSLGAAGSLWLILNPLDLCSPSFQLSYSASFIILELIPFLTNYNNKISDKFNFLLFKYVVTPTIITVAVVITTTPILLFHFGAISLGALVLNIPALIIVTLAIYLFFTGVILQFLLGNLLINCSALLIESLFNMVKFSVFHITFKLNLTPIAFIYILSLFLIFIILKIIPTVNFYKKLIILNTVLILSVFTNLLIFDNNSLILFRNSTNDISIINRSNKNIVATINTSKNLNQIIVQKVFQQWQRYSKTNTINLLVLQDTEQLEQIIPIIQTYNVKNIIIRHDNVNEDLELLNTLSKESHFNYYFCQNDTLSIHNTIKDVSTKISSELIEVKFKAQDIKDIDISKNIKTNYYNSKLIRIRPFTCSIDIET